MSIAFSPFHQKNSPADEGGAVLPVPENIRLFRTAILFQFSVDFVRNRLAPFIGGFFSRHFYRQVGEPFVRRCSVPVLYLRRNVNAVARFHFYRFLAFFLVIAPACDAYQDLSAAVFCVMDVPVVTAVNWTPSPQSLVVVGFNAIHVCALCEPFRTSSFFQVTSLLHPRS